MKRPNRPAERPSCRAVDRSHSPNRKNWGAANIGAVIVFCPLMRSGPVETGAQVAELGFDDE